MFPASISHLKMDLGCPRECELKEAGMWGPAWCSAQLLLSTHMCEPSG
jgi:hypothetical protein